MDGDARGMSRPAPLEWQRASYHFHTYAYRDPRSAFASAVGSPVVSPTTVLLGIASTLFSLGVADQAQAFLGLIHACRVLVDPPDAVIFFRAFHQLRRYETDKYDRSNPRLGLTVINQGTREYGLVQGSVTLYVGTPSQLSDSVRLALLNRDHLGTHDSMCSLVGDVERCAEPINVTYAAPGHPFPAEDITVVTLSRFKDEPITPTLQHWWMAGGPNTELVPYVIKGRFSGTSRGKIYRKSP